MNKLNLFVLVWGVILVFAGFAWIVIVYAGPIKDMEQTSSLSKSSLNIYSRNTYMIETTVVAFFISLLGFIMLAYGIKSFTWLAIINFIAIAFSFICILSTVGYFGYNYFKFNSATDATFGSSLTLWEEKVCDDVK